MDPIVQQALEGEYGFRLLRRIGRGDLPRCGRPGRLKMCLVP